MALGELYGSSRQDQDDCDDDQEEEEKKGEVEEDKKQTPKSDRRRRNHQRGSLRANSSDDAVTDPRRLNTILQTDASPSPMEDRSVVSSASRRSTRSAKKGRHRLSLTSGTGMGSSSFSSKQQRRNSSSVVSVVQNSVTVSGSLAAALSAAATALKTDDENDDNDNDENENDQQSKGGDAISMAASEPAMATSSRRRSSLATPSRSGRLLSDRVRRKSSAVGDDDNTLPSVRTTVSADMRTRPRRESSLRVDRERERLNKERSISGRKERDPVCVLLWAWLRMRGWHRLLRHLRRGGLQG